MSSPTSGPVIGDALHIAHLVVRHHEISVAALARRSDLDSGRLDRAIRKVVSAGLAVRADGGAGVVLQSTRVLPPRPSSGHRVAAWLREGDLNSRQIYGHENCPQTTVVRVRQAIRAAKKDIVIVLASEGAATVATRWAGRALLEGLRRGVEIRIGIDAAHARQNSEAVHAMGAQLAEAGAEVGYCLAPVRRTVLVADRVSSVLEQPGAGSEPAISLVVDPVVGEIVHDHATVSCRDMTPFGAEPPSEPNETDRRIIALLRAGSTDASAARKLGITDRTFRRHVKAMCERLDARSRFEAGVAAVLRGWVS